MCKKVQQVTGQIENNAKHWENIKQCKFVVKILFIPLFVKYSISQIVRYGDDNLT